MIICDVYEKITIMGDINRLFDLLHTLEPKTYKVFDQKDKHIGQVIVYEPKHYEILQELLVFEKYSDTELNRVKSWFDGMNKYDDESCTENEVCVRFDRRYKYERVLLYGMENPDTMIEAEMIFKDVHRFFKNVYFGVDKTDLINHIKRMDEYVPLRVYVI